MCAAVYLIGLRQVIEKVLNRNMLFLFPHWLFKWLNRKPTANWLLIRKNPIKPNTMFTTCYGNDQYCSDTDYLLLVASMTGDLKVQCSLRLLV